MESIDSKMSASMLRERVSQAAKVSGEHRILIGLRHSDLSMQVVEDGIRNQNPQANAEEVRQLLTARIELMRRMERRHEHL
jgi:hypothetical protein